MLMKKTLTVGGYSFDIINIDVEELYQNLRELLNDFNVKFINRIEGDFSDI